MMFPYAATAINFYDHSEGKVKEWYWDFGDGNTSPEQNPLFIFKHTVSSPEIKINPYRIVSLTILTDSCKSFYSDTINIYTDTNPPVEPDSTCHAWFKYYTPDDVVTIPEVKPYQLVDVSEGDVVRRLWQFENGKTSIEEKPLVTFDIFKATQKVCLTITTADSCMSTWCDVIYVSDYNGDSSYVEVPYCPYNMRISSYFPIQMSSCAGTAHAQVYLGDSLVQAEDYAWSDGTMGQDVKYLCPTQTYTVKARTTDDCIVSTTFIFNSDGSVTEIPISWWITGSRDQQVVWTIPTGENLTVEWRLCDGTVVKSDSIPLAAINCGDQESNLIVKDSAGNIVYTEKISVKSSLTFIQDKKEGMTTDIFPNPVNETLNIRNSGDRLNRFHLEIVDALGKSIILREMSSLEPGQIISLDVSSLKKGIYLCKMVMNNQSMVVRKFTK